MTSIVVSARVGEAEYIRGLRALTWAQPVVRRTCVGAIVAFLASAICLLRSQMVPPSIDTIVAAVIALFCGMYIFMTWRIPVISTRQFFASSPEALDTITWTFTAAGVDVATSKSRTTMAWNGITAATENRDFIFLYRATANALMIPKQAIIGSEVALRHLLVHSLGSRAKGIRPNEHGA
jgi:YcxB-like protein